MLRRKKIRDKKSRAPPNYVGRIGLNLNFKVNLKVKKASNEKSVKFWGFLVDLWGKEKTFKIL